MFTIKLKGRTVDENSKPVFVLHKMLIVEATKVELHFLRPDELTEIEGDNVQGEHFALYVANPDKPRPDGFAREVVFWDYAYIENANGKTTEMINWS